MLGHGPGSDATEAYSHLLIDPVRTAAEKAAEVMLRDWDEATEA